MIKQTSTGREVDIAFPRRGSFSHIDHIHYLARISQSFHAVVSRILHALLTTSPLSRTGRHFGAINRNPSHFTFTFLSITSLTTPSWHTLSRSFLQESKRERERERKTARKQQLDVLFTRWKYSAENIQRNVT